MSDLERGWMRQLRSGWHPCFGYHVSLIKRLRPRSAVSTQWEDDLQRFAITFLVSIYFITRACLDGGLSHCGQVLAILSSDLNLLKPHPW
jgi:hypothetical protein